MLPPYPYVYLSLNSQPSPVKSTMCKGALPRCQNGIFMPLLL